MGDDEHEAELAVRAYGVCVKNLPKGELPDLDGVRRNFGTESGVVDGDVAATSFHDHDDEQRPYMDSRRAETYVLPHSPPLGTHARQMPGLRRSLPTYSIRNPSSHGHKQISKG